MKNKKKKNNKGFTLIELLAVIVILVLILAIAIPNIFSAVERQKCKQTNTQIDFIKSAAKLYVSEHRNTYKVASTDNIMGIDISDLGLSDDELKDGDDAIIKGIIKYDGSDYYFCPDDNYSYSCGDKPTECGQ